MTSFRPLSLISHNVTSTGCHIWLISPKNDRISTSVRRAIEKIAKGTVVLYIQKHFAP